MDFNLEAKTECARPIRLQRPLPAPPCVGVARAGGAEVSSFPSRITGTTTDSIESNDNDFNDLGPCVNVSLVGRRCPNSFPPANVPRGRTNTMKTPTHKGNLKALIYIDLKHLDRLDPDEIDERDQFVYQALIVRPEHKEFMKGFPTTDHVSQEEFARFMNVDHSRISRLLARRVLTRAMPWRIWFLQITAYTLGVVAGRKGSGY